MTHTTEFTVLSLAEEMSRKSFLNSKHCCIITPYKSTKILSCGINNSGRNGSTQTKHAELNAFRFLPYREPRKERYQSGFGCVCGEVRVEKLKAL